MDRYDAWLTSPPECSHCGGEHSRRYCADLKELEAEAAERKADEMRDARMLKRLHPEDD
jgi:hypothetical protein